MEDGEIRISTKIDTDEVDKGLDKLNKNLDKSKKQAEKTGEQTDKLKSSMKDASKESKDFATSIKDIVNKLGPMGVALGAGVKTLKEIGKVMRDTSLIYRDHENAQSMLNFAIDNSPYINGTAKKALSEYAKELEKVTELQDNEISTVMAQLVATGRTETEVRKLITASVDYASVSGESLESVATKLNATYTGMAGQLGRQHVEIKGLTEEQLKNGEAIDIVAKKYAGFAEELANADVKAANAKKSFQEAFGKLMDPLAEKWDNFWGDFYTKAANSLDKIADRIQGLRGLDDIVSIDDVVSGKEIDASSFKKLRDSEIANIIKQSEEFEKEIKNRIEEQSKQIEKMPSWMTASARASIALATKQLEAYKNVRLKLLEEVEIREADESVKKAEQKKAEQEAELKRLEALKKTAEDYAKESNQALAEQIRILELKASLNGELIDQQALYNLYEQSYVNLLTQTEGKIKEEYPVAQKRIEQMEEARKAIEEATEAEKKRIAVLDYALEITNAFNDVQIPQDEYKQAVQELENLKNAIKSVTDEELALAQAGQDVVLSKEELLKLIAETEKQLLKNKVSEISEIEQNEFDAFKDRQKERLELIDEINKSEVLSAQEKADAISDINRKQKQEEKDFFNTLVGYASGYANQTASIMKDASSLMLDIVQKRADAELEAVSQKYLDGVISEEEYNAEIIRIKKEQANEEYKIRMFEWSASLLQAGANIAEGITKAIAQGGMLGLITGGLISAAGLVQIASLTASKPQPPKFAGGGIVGGGSYYGDNVQAMVNSREMVLNMGQQKNLLDMINTGREGGVILNQPINIENYTDAQVSTEQSEDGLRMVIDYAVNKSLQQGRYNRSLGVAEGRQRGVKLL